DSEGKTIVLSIVDPSTNTDLSQHYTLNPTNPKATITITGPATITPTRTGGPIGGPAVTPPPPDPDPHPPDPDPPTPDHPPSPRPRPRRPGPRRR
nr:hypothetical protein [Acidimicrobiia bacterium]